MALIPILIVVILFALLFSVIILVKSAKNKSSSLKKGDVVQKKGRAAVIKEAEKRLIKDPRDINALETLGKLYFQEENWDSAAGIYKTLYDLSGVHPEIDGLNAAKKMGISYYKSGKVDEAQSAFMMAGKKDPNDFDVNFYLGKVFLDKNIYDKAAACLKKCKILNPENTELSGLIASTLFKQSKFRECLPFYKQALDVDPGNKEILFNMAMAMAESGLGDKALKVFVHLRPDPVYGPQSCLEAGKLHEKVKNTTAAIQDYEIASKLPAVPDQIKLQIKYRCGNCYISMNDIPKALVCYNQILDINPNYKDVAGLVSRYSELNQNKNLKTYLLAGTSDFVALCRKLIPLFNPNSVIQVEDVVVETQSVEISCVVTNNKNETKQLFRFYRVQSQIGDVYVREFHSKMRDMKCDIGYCITQAEFSDAAHRYVEGRPLDLIEKDKLTKLLKQITVMN